MKAIIFYNWSGEEFSCSWDGEHYRFPAGKEMMLDEGIAMTFAKHLADREMDKNGKSPLLRDVHAEYVQRALVLPDKPVESENKDKFEAEIANANKEKEEAGKEALWAKLTELGVKYDKRWGIDRLEALILEEKVKENTKEEFEGVDEEEKTEE